MANRLFTYYGRDKMIANPFFEHHINNTITPLSQMLCPSDIFNSCVHKFYCTLEVQNTACDGKDERKKNKTSTKTVTQKIEKFLTNLLTSR